MSTYTVSISRDYKVFGNQETRKQVRVVRFGEIQRYIMAFACEHYLIEAAQVRVWVKQKFNVDIDLRRIHDALQRLVKNNIVRKVVRGVYMLTDLGRQILAAVKDKLDSVKRSISKKLRPDKESDGHGVARGVGFDRFRVHVYGQDVENLVKQLVAAKKVIECSLRFLRQLVGRSRFYRISRSVVVECLDYFVGVHGFSGFKSGSRPLVGFDKVFSLGLKPREIGVDVFVASNIGKMFVKVYRG
jgi:DNA-binding MarR family transcriptional regulator